MKQILIVDDDPAVTNYLMVFLMQTGLFETTVVNDSREVAGLMEGDPFDIVLLDMDMPNVSGMDILGSMRAKGMDTPVVVLTGVSDVDLAVRAMKLGAFDYLIKPVDDDNLLEVLNNAMEHNVLNRSIETLPEELARTDLEHADAFEHFSTQDQGMIRLFHQADKVASSDLSIFIWGESGTGKEALARAIHAASPRRERPFVAAEADSQEPGTFPAFFFGQDKTWAGTREEQPGILEEANHGTLFLNHIDALSAPVQVRLKRFLQTGEYYRENSTQIRKADVRMVVASTKDLASPGYKSKFSRDVLYHLMINSIQMPPLRERPGDIPLLIKKFLASESKRSGKRFEGYSDGVIDYLKAYSFPNNVQELRTIIAGAVAGADSGALSIEMLPPSVMQMIEADKAAGPAEFVPRRLEDVVKDFVLQTLEHFSQERDVAALELGITLEELDRITK
ncbi:sigma-54-dependent transcriptional regulator [Candidatus Eisenbacteria bacterium]|uniref:Sigma-54-dependent transcriptional regulator n=1 Tax=Eiseniibacteriota bacterium TaxID=2212470 RepID=A0ABV6YPK1_UNCEI